MKKVIIVDDEKASRQLIKEYISAFPAFIILAEANNGVDAIKLINEYKPDLLFLDIQMPGLNGFEVITQLEEIPQVIFSTAFDQYAFQAFEVHAVDYLLKPYTRERFKVALERISFRNSNDSIRSFTENLIRDKQGYHNRILIQSSKKIIAIAVSEIIRIEAYGDYSKLITTDNTFTSNFGIGALEKRLDPKIFIRIHRSAMINIHFIKEIDKHPNSYEILMKNGSKVRVSRGYMESIRVLIY